MSGAANPVIISTTRRAKQSVAALCRQYVEQGFEDAPFEVWFDGVHCLSGRSLHRYALMAVTEGPALRQVQWAPHPNSEVGQRVQALLDAREIDRRLRKEYGV